MTKSVEEEFLESKDFYNISDVFAISEVSKVIVLGTIMGIYKDEGWFYDGCNRCNKKINKEPVFIDEAKENGSVAEKEVLTCISVRCINKEITASPKFKIHIRVQDPSASVTLTLFDREAWKLVGKSVVDILDANPEFRSDPLKTPAELDVLVNQKVAFKIEVTKYVLKYNIQKYGITKLIVDPNVISVLEQKQCFPQITVCSAFPINYVSLCYLIFFSLNMFTSILFYYIPFHNCLFSRTQGLENCSMNLGISDFQSQSADEVKDCLATGSVNTTPVSNMDNTVSPVVLADMDTPTTIANKDDVKRNLVEVYDEEEHCLMSETKVHKSSEMEHVNSDEKKKLLIPKLEK
ncbi:putative nucleic acid-binding, replication factor A [Helianthus annuus]|nr:putative nucleic acid-binding, replication factor A [Helianthus annuus]